MSKLSISNILIGIIIGVLSSSLFFKYYEKNLCTQPPQYLFNSKKVLMVKNNTLKNKLPIKLNAHVIAKYVANNYDIPYQEAADIAKAHVDASKKYNIPLEVGLGINHQESRFQRKAISYNNTSYGLMQINFNVWKDTFKLTKGNVFQIHKNVDTGYRILARNLKSSNNLKEAIAKYYGSTNKRENQKYVNMIIKHAYMFKYLEPQSYT